MKKHLFLSLVTAAGILLSFGGCQNKNNKRETHSSLPSHVSTISSLPSGMPIESFPAVSSDGSSAPASSIQPSETDASQESSEEVSQEEIQLPVGVSRAGKGKLKFTTSVLSLSAVFPEEFCLLNTDYYPSYGIYLKNKEGTATLLLASVVDETLTYRRMAEYLREKYPSAKVSTNDNKDVVCKMAMTDGEGNKLFVFQKIRVRTGGYNEIVLCCRAEDTPRYEKEFNEINFR